MRLLLLTFYYPPDLSAGAFRAGALIKALKQLDIPDLQIEVITTQPNRYHSFAERAPSTEEADGVLIRRIPLPAHQSGMRDQALAFVGFARQVLRETRRSPFDIVVATSSRLMTAALGAWIARRADAPLYLDIRDLFTDTIHDVLGRGAIRFTLLPTIRWIERKTLRSAARINIVSEGFLPHIRRLVPSATPTVYSNGIDETFIDKDFTNSFSEENYVPVILYAGNIGEGQGLDHIIPDAIKKLNGRAKFRIIGDGGKKHSLVESLRDFTKGEVDILPPMSRNDLITHYKKSDILFIHLNNYEAFTKVIPSKIFEYAATGKPILAGVSGYPAQFIEKNVQGSAIFEPRDSDMLVSSFDKLVNIREVDRRDFIQRYSRQKIMRALANDIIELGQSVKS